jgi:MscS family membrane protein
VLGFMAAMRKGDDERATRYLNTPKRGLEATELARQLYVILDRRLPARLYELSDLPLGNMGDLDKPDLDLVGTIDSASGQVDILVERVNRGAAGALWLFAAKSLDAVPQLYEELDAVGIEDVLPRFLLNFRIASIPLYEWLALLVLLPFLYIGGAFLNRRLSDMIGRWYQHLRKKPEPPHLDVLPSPLRLFLLALIIKWTLSRVTFPLLARQFWSSFAAVMMIAALAWTVIMLNGWIEGYARRRFSQELSGKLAILHFARRGLDLAVVLGGVLFTLFHFGIDPTAALAGVGVGGIAIALAAQKTLENVIGGLSLIFDETIHVGDVLKLGDTEGIVQSIGLRSTSIRTFNRTVVSVPNGQISNASVENQSVRDKFWLHHMLGLHYETTAAQMRRAIQSVNRLLMEDPRVEGGSVRVRFVRFGDSSLDIEVFAYCIARDWGHFLEIQGQLLLKFMEAVQEAGTRVALPTRTMYLSDTRNPAGEQASPMMLALRQQGTETGKSETSGL